MSSAQNKKAVTEATAKRQPRGMEADARENGAVRISSRLLVVLLECFWVGQLQIHPVGLRDSRAAPLRHVLGRNIKNSSQGGVSA